MSAATPNRIRPSAPAIGDRLERGLRMAISATSSAMGRSPAAAASACVDAAAVPEGDPSRRQARAVPDVAYNAASIMASSPSTGPARIRPLRGLLSVRRHERRFAAVVGHRRDRPPGRGTPPRLPEQAFYQIGQTPPTTARRSMTSRAETTRRCSSTRTTTPLISRVTAPALVGTRSLASVARSHRRSSTCWPVTSRPATARRPSRQPSRSRTRSRSSPARSIRTEAFRPEPKRLST